MTYIPDAPISGPRVGRRMTISWPRITTTTSQIRESGLVTFGGFSLMVMWPELLQVGPQESGRKPTAPIMLSVHQT